MKKRNFFANKENSSFLNLVKVITENLDDETEGLDFEDDAEGMDDEMPEDDFGAEDDMVDDEMADDDMVSIELPRSVAEQLYDVLGAMLGGGEEMNDDEFGDDEMADDEFADEEGDDFGAEDETEDEMFPEDEEEEDAEEEDAEEEDECDVEDKNKAHEEDEEVLGSDMSNVAQSTISRQGAPKRSKANTSWNTGKTVKSVFDQTVSHEGEPAGVNRDGAPKRSKFTKEPNRSKTVSSRLQPGKHAFEIGK
jgi:hypothetical protein